MKRRDSVCLLLALSFIFVARSESASAEAPEPIRNEASEVSIEINPQTNVLTLLIDHQPFKRYRIALGKPETPTPVGEYVVINKYKNWGSGFGTRWIGLNVPWGIYGIHGTNNPRSIGHDASHGCVRMLNRQVEELFEYVEIGSKVTILGHVLGEPDQDPRPLAKGDAGGDVMLIQYRLRSAGFYDGECNGKFGPGTERALKAYEKANGLPVDGVVGYRDYQSFGLWE